MQRVVRLMAIGIFCFFGQVLAGEPQTVIVCEWNDNPKKLNGVDVKPIKRTIIAIDVVPSTQEQFLLIDDGKGWLALSSSVITSTAIVSELPNVLYSTDPPEISSAAISIDRISGKAKLGRSDAEGIAQVWLGECRKQVPLF